jgi:ribosomal protein L31
MPGIPELGRIKVQDQPEQKVIEIPKTTNNNKNKLGIVACTCHPSYTGGKQNNQDSDQPR